MARDLLGDEGEAPSVSKFSREQMCALLLRNELPNG
jgi:hypothetical protein